MKIICKEKTAKNLNLAEVTIISRKDYDFGLILEKEYVVLGLAIYKDFPCLYYLIDENSLPRWYPYPLFEVSDSCITEKWYVAVQRQDSPGDIHYLSGFYELCCNEDFYDALMDREEWAMDIYFKHKHEAQRDIF